MNGASFDLQNMNYVKIRYVDGPSTCEVTPVTIRCIHPPHNGQTKVNVMVMNGRLTSLSYHVHRPSHSRDKAMSNFAHEISRTRSWVWSRGQGRVVNPISNWLISFSLHTNQTHNSWDTYSYFEIWPCKIKVKDMGEVKDALFTQYPTDALPFHFTSIGPTFPEIWPIECSILKKKTHAKFWKEIAPPKKTPKKQQQQTNKKTNKQTK